ncbi:CDP-diacylglycerol--inositol 3-phosphatidyltransferase-like isoform X2 [Amphiura filiformis]|uniref:CDP-diacylglycerol--inositol 3-phosphatidyltransferase-like isoform X2 n=1 Tax=Amphiura filiformis TaxID=82378 RepID=UPI003B21013B
MAENIFLFVPNLIGYGRIILMIMAFWCMQTDYIQATFYYLLSGLLDAFDGHAARMLNQGTKFGAMLDQLTDRAGTLGLLIMLGTLYPSYVFWFQISACLDIVSHWLHLHSSATSGKSSHKSIDLSGNPVLHLYYTNRQFLFFMCSGNELFYAMVYLLYFTEGPSLYFIGLFRLIVYLTAPISLVKSGISLIHLITASMDMGAVDVAEREKAAAEAKKE